MKKEKKFEKVVEWDEKPSIGFILFVLFFYSFYSFCGFILPFQYNSSYFVWGFLTIYAIIMVYKSLGKGKKVYWREIKWQKKKEKNGLKEYGLL